MPITDKDVERLREREAQRKFTVKIVTIGGGLLLKKGDILRVLSVDGDRITVVPDSYFCD